VKYWNELETEAESDMKISEFCPGFRHRFSHTFFVHIYIIQIKWTALVRKIASIWWKIQIKW